jgi:inosine/xanthosine triphosphate pyrophosphatase family protein
MKQNSILLATSNPDKQRTFRWVLDDLPLTLVTPQDLGLTSVPEENGETHHQVARQKARQWSRTSAMPAIASDGGLVVPVLGEDWASLYTHRFAGEDADDAARVTRLLELLKPYVDEERKASWVEALAIACRGRILASWQVDGATGLISQHVPPQVTETRGFWAFNLWEFPHLGKFYRQLSTQELETLDDHWFRLRGLVRRFFQSHFVTLFH